MATSASTRGIATLLICALGSACSSDDDGDGTAIEPVESAAPVLPDTATALDRDIVAIMGETGTPGLQVAAVKDGTVVWSNFYGQAVAEPLPAAAVGGDTIFNIGSVSKLLIAIACMQLVEAGLAGLDNDIGGALPWPVRNPDFPDAPITWRMLMTHTSSIIDSDRTMDESYVYGSDHPTALSAFMDDVFSPDGAYFGPSTFNRAQPGTTFVNSTYGVALAAYAVERIVGQPFHAYVRAHILDPLGVSTTSYFLADLPVERLAVPYRCNPNRRGRFACTSYGVDDTVLGHQYSYPNYPDRLVRTSAREYAKVVALLLEGGRVGDTVLLQPESVQQLLTAGRVANAFGTPQGLILFRAAEEPAWGLGGSDRGMAAAAFLEPETRVGAVAFANSQDAEELTTDNLIEIVLRMIAEFR